MPDHDSNYPKDCSTRIGEQLCAEGGAEVCLIDGEKYESGVQGNTLTSTFFGPISFWTLPLMEKGSPVPRKWTKKNSEKFCGILGICVVIDFGSKGGLSVKNRFSQIFPASGGSPPQSLFMRCKLEKRLRSAYFLTEWGGTPLVYHAFQLLGDCWIYYELYCIDFSVFVILFWDF